MAGAVTGLITAAAFAVLAPKEERGVCLGAFMIPGSLIGPGLAPALAVAGVAMGLLSLDGFIPAMRNAPDKVAATA